MLVMVKSFFQKNIRKTVFAFVIFLSLFIIWRKTAKPVSDITSMVPVEKRIDPLLLPKRQDGLTLKDPEQIYRTKIQFLEDKTGSENLFSIVEKVKKGAFTPTENEVKNFGFSNSVYWFYIPMRDTSDINTQWILFFKYPLIQNIDIFYVNLTGEVFQNKIGLFESQHSASNMIISRYLHSSIPRSLKGDYFIFYRVKTISNIRIDARIETMKKFQGQDHYDQLLFSIYYGIIFAMIMYNLFVYISVRDKSYLFYVFFSMSFVSFISLLNGEPAALFAKFPTAYYSCISMAICFSTFFGLRFNSFFMQVPSSLPRISNLFTYLNITCLIFAPFCFLLPYLFSIKATTISTIFIPLLGISTGIVRLKQGFSPAKYYVFSWFLLIMGLFLYALMSYGLIGENALNENLMQFGSSIETILLSFAVGDRINHERKEKEKAQAEAIKVLKEADKIKDEFLANTSHELRTPLNGIIGITEAMLDDPEKNLTQDQKYNLTLVVTCGRRLASLVNDILDFSKVKNNDLVISQKAISAQDMVSFVLTLSKPLLGVKQVEIINALPEDLPPIYADENRFQQILHNIIGNSIKFTHEGHIKISAEIQDGFIAFSISDTGIGIPADKQKEIFEPFKQVDGSISRLYGGTGLGLSITKLLIELHGGNITLQSELNKGTTFRFTMQIATNQEVVSSPKSLKIFDKIAHPRPISIAEENTLITKNLASHVEQVKENSYTVVAVDDEPVNCQVIQNQLSSIGYNVSVFTEGKNAIEHILANKPDVVLLDVMMPHLNGLEVCSKIREKYNRVELPILFLTAKNQIETVVDCFNIGGNDYIIKPFCKAELSIKIGCHIEISKYSKLIAEAKLEELGKVALYLGDKLNNPLQVATFLTEEIDDFRQEENTSIDKSQEMLIHISNTINKIINEIEKNITVFTKYKSHIKSVSDFEIE